MNAGLANGEQAWATGGDPASRPVDERQHDGLGLFQVPKVHRRVLARCGGALVVPVQVASESLCRELMKRRSLSMALGNQALVLRQLGRFQEALDVFTTFQLANEAAQAQDLLASKERSTP